MDQVSQASLDTIMEFMRAMGSGEVEAMGALMAPDMVWRNEGDGSLPWIGEWAGPEKISEFLGLFSSNLKTVLWENTDAFASGDTVAVFGQMNAVVTRTGAQTGVFSFALRAKVRDGRVVLWHWHEDSFAVREAYHDRTPDEDASPRRGLENVRSLYLEGIAGGEARGAVEKYTGHRYTQHSTGVGDGAEGFQSFFEPFLERNPERDIEIVRIFEDGPWVFCSASQSLNGGAARWVTMDLFYTDHDGLILEHWDTITAYVSETASGEDMVAGVSEVDVSVDTSETKALVLEYSKQVLQGGGHDKLAAFVAQDMIQHAPSIGAGRAGLADWLGSDASGSYEMLFQLMGQGDFAVTYGKRHAGGKDFAVFDVYRVAGGKIVEHWENAEEIGPRETWGNAGKF